MKKQFSLIIFVLGLLAFPQLANAQTTRNPCYTTGPQGNTGLPNCIPVGTYTSTAAWGPLPVGGLATAAAPTFLEGKMGGFSFDLSGNLRTTASGGGGGGAVTIADGADVAEGATTDAAATAGSTGTVSSKLRLMTTQLNTINTTLGSPLQAGGTVSATQGTSPWVVSGTVTLAANQSVNVAQVNGVTTSVNTGAVGTGTQRIAVGTDTATIAGSAPGTAGTASTNVISVQGIASMTPVQTLAVPSSSSSIGITPIVSTAAEATHVLKAGAGNAYAAYATNLTATAGFLVLLNSTSAPADGAITPLACAPLSANGSASINYSPGPPGVFSTGITAVVTSATTCFTKTTGTITAFISGLVQ